MTATFGGTLNLACNVKTNVTDGVFGWHKLSIKDTWLTLKNFSGVKPTYLTIKKVDTNDAGVYRCFVYDTKTKNGTYSSNITVMVSGTFNV